MRLSCCAGAVVAWLLLVPAEGWAQANPDPPSTWSRFKDRTKNLLVGPPSEVSQASASESDDRRAVRRAHWQETPGSGKPPGKRTTFAEPKSPSPPRATLFKRGPAKPRRTVSQYMAQERP